jgi:hypothetical protein
MTHRLPHWLPSASRTAQLGRTGALVRWSGAVETMGLEPTTPCLQTVWTTGLGELSWAPTRTERPGATSMVRVVWHMRGTAEHGITSLVYSEPTYDNGRRGPGRSAGRTVVTVAGLARPRDGRAIEAGIVSLGTAPAIPVVSGGLARRARRPASFDRQRPARVARAGGAWPRGTPVAPSRPPPCETRSLVAGSDGCGHALGGLARVVVLPHSDDGPAGALELGGGVSVTLDVPRDLAVPVPLVHRRASTVVAASVPEAAVHEDRDPDARKHDVY